MNFLYRRTSHSPLHDSDHIAFLNFSPLRVLDIVPQIIAELFKELIACLQHSLKCIFDGPF